MPETREGMAPLSPAPGGAHGSAAGGGGAGGGVSRASAGGSAGEEYGSPTVSGYMARIAEHYSKAERSGGTGGGVDEAGGEGDGGEGLFGEGASESGFDDAPSEGLDGLGGEGGEGAEGDADEWAALLAQGEEEAGGEDRPFGAGEEAPLEDGALGGEGEAGAQTDAAAQAGAEERRLQSARSQEELRRIFKLRPDVGAAYRRDQAAQKAGLTEDFVAELSRRGIAPSSVLELHELFRTTDDAKVAAEDALGLRSFVSDFRKSPEALLSNLAAIDRAAYARLVRTAAERIPKSVRERRLSKDVWSMLGAAEKRAEEAGDLDQTDAIQRVKAALFERPGPSSSAASSSASGLSGLGAEGKGELPREILRDLAELDERRRYDGEFLEERRQGFGTDFVESLDARLTKKAEEKLQELFPAGLDEEIQAKILDETRSLVRADFDRSPIQVARLEELLSSGGYDDAHLAHVLGYVVPRAEASLSQRLVERVTWWKKKARLAAPPSKQRSASGGGPPGASRTSSPSAPASQRAARLELATSLRRGGSPSPTRPTGRLRLPSGVPYQEIVRKYLG